MPKPIISDTSCFIVLSNIGELELLRKVYGQVITTPEVMMEYGEALPSWVEINAAGDRYAQQVLELQLDIGEASAIALAIEMSECTIILDDYKARKVAEKLGLTITGTIGVLVKAKLNGVIPSIMVYLDKIRKTDFYISDELYAKALQEAGE